MRHFLLTTGILGAVLFSIAFVASLLNPLLIERTARGLIRLEVERRVSVKFAELSNSTLASMAGKALGKSESELETAKQALAEEIPQRVASVVADMLNADCPCRKRLMAISIDAQNNRIASLTNARERLASLIETAYSTVAANLLKEFRVFTASNALAFAALALVTQLRRRASLQLALPGVVLIGAVGITGGLYLFNQDWLHTILYGQYVGLAYVAYLGGAVVLLADVVFNRARVTTRIINIGLQVVGSALKAVPC